jgi:hypothetical protein
MAIFVMALIFREHFCIHYPINPHSNPVKCIYTNQDSEGYSICLLCGRLALPGQSVSYTPEGRGRVFELTWKPA